MIVDKTSGASIRKKATFISTGMSDLKMIDDAVDMFKKTGI